MFGVQRSWPTRLASSPTFGLFRVIVVPSVSPATDVISIFVQSWSTMGASVKDTNLTSLP